MKSHRWRISATRKGGTRWSIVIFTIIPLLMSTFIPLITPTTANARIPEPSDPEPTPLLIDNLLNLACPSTASSAVDGACKKDFKEKVYEPCYNELTIASGGKTEPSAEAMADCIHNKKPTINTSVVITALNGTETTETTGTTETDCDWGGQKEVMDLGIPYYDVASCTCSDKSGGAIGGGSTGSSSLEFTLAEVVGFANQPIGTTWNLSDSTVESWFLSQTGGVKDNVIIPYNINSSNIGAITAAVKAAGVSPAFFYIYAVNEGGNKTHTGAFINHWEHGPVATPDRAVADAQKDANYLATESQIMSNDPATGGGEPDDMPTAEAVALLATLPAGSIGRIYIRATAAVTAEIEDLYGKTGDWTGKFGHPLSTAMQKIKNMGGDPMVGGTVIAPTVGASGGSSSTGSSGCSSSGGGTGGGVVVDGKTFPLAGIPKASMDYGGGGAGSHTDSGCGYYYAYDLMVNQDADKVKIVAITDGTISDKITIESYNLSGQYYGWKFGIDTKDGLYYYTHMKKPDVTKGQSVKVGDVLGTGLELVNAYHLHTDLSPGGKRVSASRGNCGSVRSDSFDKNYGETLKKLWEAISD